ncbi:hypothetical protein E4U35_003605 [Claviceps purpurea]|nr:hypothetical protein E4U35_003605 [Claviceps purpurea]
MIKFLSVVIATLAAVTPVVQAGSCTPGLDYCGSTLMQYGWSTFGLATMGLYHCTSSGNVTPKEYCYVQCRDGGAGMSDYCQK